MQRPSISAVCIPYNEEHALARALASASWRDESVVERVTPELRQATERGVLAPGDKIGFAVQWCTCYVGECFGYRALNHC